VEVVNLPPLPSALSRVVASNLAFYRPGGLVSGVPVPKSPSMSQTVDEGWEGDMKQFGTSPERLYALAAVLAVAALFLALAIAESLGG
jgi:hypothetical protein